MINCIVRTSTVPDIFKLSRILPLSKPQKPRDNISSYRPLNNLPCLEKLFEAHILTHLNNYLDDNKIIVPYHHGGRKSHSTTTALAEILYRINKNYDNDKIIAVLITDLSAAYDTVDSEILLKKLQYYGIKNKSLDLFKSYLCNRKQFVWLETANSEIKLSPACSVVQGSKLSSVLYNIYTNEIPLLYKLINDETYETLTFENLHKFSNVDHNTVNFVDDSTSVITLKMDTK